MSSFPEQNDPHYSKKIPLICSKFRFSDYISIILSGCPPLGLIKPRGGHPSKIHVSTVCIRLPDRKVLFDSFVKRKLRLPMSRGHVLFLEFFRIYSIKKMCYVHKFTTLVSVLLVLLRHIFQTFESTVWTLLHNQTNQTNYWRIVILGITFEYFQSFIINNWFIWSY